MPTIEPKDYDHWLEITTRTLRDELPLDLLPETTDALATSICHSGITIEDGDEDLPLSTLDSHPLCTLLQDQILPLLPSETSWSFLTTTLLQNHRRLLLTTENDVSDTKKGERRRVSCELCERVMPLTVHHLIPRSTHAFFATHLHQLDPPLPQDTKKSDLALIQAHFCRPCHSQVHALVPDHRELATQYASVEKLLSRQDVGKWVAYISSQRGSDKTMGKGLRYRR